MAQFKLFLRLLGSQKISIKNVGQLVKFVITQLNLLLKLLDFLVSQCKLLLSLTQLHADEI